jgi:uncharacterized protein YoxC
MTKEEAIKNIPIGSIWQDKYSKEAIEITSIREESYMGGGYLPYQSIKYILICYKFDRGTDQRELDIFLREFEKQSDNYTLKTEPQELTQEKNYLIARIDELTQEKNYLIARIDDLTLEKADMGAKLQGIEEYCEQEKTKVQHMIDCLETGDDFCAVDKGRVEAYTDILSRLKEER